MKKVLSVIIPVYNMEKYIRQCLESLMIKEVLDKIEILVVLDGSTDRSEEIAMEYAKAHPYSPTALSIPVLIADPWPPLGLLITRTE